MNRSIDSCEEALRLLAAHLDGELDADSGAGLEQHLDACRSCCSRAEFERRLKAQVAALGREPVRPELGRRVSAMIRSFDVTDG
jgi:anti-sigma factor (TIGR02949 family)